MIRDNGTNDVTSTLSEHDAYELKNAALLASNDDFQKELAIES
jgi:hypothetical protein